MDASSNTPPDASPDASIAAFDFALPDAQIARRPLAQRDASRLLVLHRPSGKISHHHFQDFPQLLDPRDLLVVNDAQVFHARLKGQKALTGGRAELLLVRPVEEVDTAEALRAPASAHEWVCLGQASKGLRVGVEIVCEGGLHARVTAELGEGEYRVRLASEHSETLGALLDHAGSLPLPPYLERPPDAEDEARYQTVFAHSAGSAAAPTAGLHFTSEVLDALQRRGIERAALTLDVGPGTFLPVRGTLDTHRMHLERFRIPEATARSIIRARSEQRRIVAAGTTVVRSLESAHSSETNQIQAGAHATQLFIRPGFAFHEVDVLLTNFHLPRSTLLMLVCAFAGTQAVLRAYAEAVREGYRFFSYGDAMLILPDMPGAAGSGTAS